MSLRHVDGRAVLTFTRASTGLDEDVELSAILTVRCRQKRCGPIAWIFDVPDARPGMSGPAIIVQRKDEARSRLRLDGVHLNTAFALDWVQAVAPGGKYRTYCGGCNTERTVSAADILNRIAEGHATLRV